MASPRTRTRTRKPKPSVERDLAVRMFEVMALTRAIEDRMVTMYRQGELLELGFLDSDGVTAVKEQAYQTALEHRNRVHGMPMPEPDDEEGRVYAD